jgi:hypothetical protein
VHSDEIFKVGLWFERPIGICVEICIVVEWPLK